MKAFSGRLRAYYQLCKPGIVYGNALTMVAGYLYAAGRHFHPLPFLAGLVGTSLVIAAACAINNYIDRGIDKAMERTKNRALVIGSIQPLAASAFAAALLVLGFGLLLAYVNVTTALVGVVGLVDYVVLYGIAKRHTPLSTLIGSISGATPIVAGYTTATGRLDTAAWLLFLIMTIWQMPHFYAIAIYRVKDYAAAKLPVLPLARSVSRARRSIMAYIVAFVAAVAVFAWKEQASAIFILFAIGSAAFWLSNASRTYRGTKPDAWARRVFFHSLLVLLAMSAGLAADGLLRR